MRWRIGLAAFFAPVVIVLFAGAQAQGLNQVDAVVAQIGTVTMR